MLSPKDYKYLMTYYDRLIDKHVNKYENYYPIDPCVQDENTPNKKKHSMCSYCYKCYVELCETISNDFNITINNRGIWTHKCLEKLCNKMPYKCVKMYELEIANKTYKQGSINIINIINKYTNYSKTQREGYNLLHREFIESLMKPLYEIMGRYFMLAEFYELPIDPTPLKYLEKCLMYKLNLFCLEAYCNYCYNYDGFVITEQVLIYKLLKNRENSKLN